MLNFGRVISSVLSNSPLLFVPYTLLLSVGVVAKLVAVESHRQFSMSVVEIKMQGRVNSGIHHL